MDGLTHIIRLELVQTGIWNDFGATKVECSDAVMGEGLKTCTSVNKVKVPHSLRAAEEASPSCVIVSGLMFWSAEAQLNHLSLPRVRAGNPVTSHPLHSLLRVWSRRPAFILICRLAAMSPVISAWAGVRGFSVGLCGGKNPLNCPPLASQRSSFYGIFWIFQYHGTSKNHVM